MRPLEKKGFAPIGCLKSATEPFLMTVVVIGNN